MAIRPLDSKRATAIGDLVRTALLSGDLSGPPCPKCISNAAPAGGRNTTSSKAAESAWPRRSVVPPSENARRARRIISFRAKLADFHGQRSSGPVFDILLQVYLADEEGIRMSVSSAADLARVTATTSIRWIDALTKAGLVCRSPDPSDARRFWLTLATEFKAQMDRLLTDLDK